MYSKLQKRYVINQDSVIKIKTYDTPKTAFIHATEDVEIPPFETSVIWIPYKKTTGDIYIRSAGKSKVIEMMATIEAEGDNAHSIPIVIVNEQPWIRSIRQGDVVASIQQVETICQIQNEEQYNEFLDKETQGEYKKRTPNNTCGTPWKPSN